MTATGRPCFFFSCSFFRFGLRIGGWEGRMVNMVPKEPALVRNPVSRDNMGISWSLMG